MAVKMEQVRLPRTGDSDVRFTGRMVGKGDSENMEGKPVGFSHQVDIYETKSGKLIGYVYYASGAIRTPDEHTIFIADTSEEAKGRASRLRIQPFRLVQVRLERSAQRQGPIRRGHRLISHARLIERAIASNAGPLAPMQD